jgi:hypothetical protein
MVYTAVPALEPVVLRRSAIVAPLPGFPPVTPLCATVHDMDVPDTLLLTEMPVVPPSQNVSVAGVAVTTGIGLTVTLTLIGVPEQPFAVGVITYVTVPAVTPVLVSVCAIIDPLPAVAPDTPLELSVQLNVADPTVLVKLTPVVAPEQIV